MNHAKLVQSRRYVGVILLPVDRAVHQERCLEMLSSRNQFPLHPEKDPEMM